MSSIDCTLAQMNIEKLIHYGIINNLIEECDTILTRNQYLDHLALDEPYDGKTEFTQTDTLENVLTSLSDYAVRNGLIPEDTSTYRDLFETKLMGILTPRQSVIAKKFYDIVREKSIQAATDFFYHFSKATNYVRVESIKKNISWQAKTEYGTIDISINLSKPEKDPREIAKLKLSKESSYPKCALCLENVGFAGSLTQAARQNHRVIPLNLSDEQWYLQYSPYVYYNEHCIVFSEEHKPMQINQQAFSRMFQFVEQFPHYFIGANAGLPIVGGSILTHDHYQGGWASFPLDKAAVDLRLLYPTYPEITITTRHWCMSFIRLAGADKHRLLELANYILQQWKEYSDESVNILASSKNAQGEVIPHNTITPIVRKTADNLFEMDLVLRNNRTSELHPDGIFHPHQDVHHIKKENIGVIEVMGLAILPGRLSKELTEIKKFLKGSAEYTRNEMENEQHLLNKHLPWIDSLNRKYSSALTDDELDQIIKEEVAQKFLAALKDASVFKQDEAGKEAFKKFLNQIGFELLP